MAIDEFQFIHQYFAHLNPDLNAKAQANGLELGIGDDAAMVKVDRSMAITTDTMIEGVHFFSDITPRILASRSLEVNFSDVYAMGALPQFVTLSLIIPKRYRENDSFWKEYSQGFAYCLRRHNSTLIGGNISSTLSPDAPLTIVVTAFGAKVDEGNILRRDEAEAGDLIYVTGPVGFNGLYIKAKYSQRIEYLSSDESMSFEQAAHFYDERMARFIEVLVKYSKCAVDVSDGLLGDLSHILVNSQCRATLKVDNLPITAIMLDYAKKLKLDHDEVTKLALSAGGDYNILYTVKPEHESALLDELNAIDCMAGFLNTKIGVIEKAQDNDFADNNTLATKDDLVRIVERDGKLSKFNQRTRSFNHFASDTASEFGK